MQDIRSGWRSKMKQGVKPTRQQRKLIEKWGLDARDWFVVKDKPTEMVIVHRLFDKQIRTITKE